MTCYMTRPAQQIRPGNEIDDDQITDAYRAQARIIRDANKGKRGAQRIPQLESPTVLVSSILLQADGTLKVELVANGTRYERVWAIGQGITVREDDPSRWPAPGPEQIRIIRAILLPGRLPKAGK
jgi:hypothetical protein